MLNKLEKKMDTKTKKELNFKLAMADELLEILNGEVEFTHSYINVCDEYSAFHKKQYLKKLEFFKELLTCKDNDTYYDITSGSISADQLNTIK